MSTHAARTEDDARVAGPKPERPAPDAAEMADRIALFLWGEADRIERHDRDMRRMAQNLHPSVSPTGPMMPEFAERFAMMQRAAKLAEHCRDDLFKKRDAGRARARNAGR